MIFLRWFIPLSSISSSTSSKSWRFSQLGGEAFCHLHQCCFLPTRACGGSQPLPCSRCPDPAQHGSRSFCSSSAELPERLVCFVAPSAQGVLCLPSSVWGKCARADPSGCCFLQLGQGQLSVKKKKTNPTETRVRRAAAVFLGAVNRAFCCFFLKLWTRVSLFQSSGANH